jgi:hypothetical protein
MNRRWLTLVLLAITVLAICITILTDWVSILRGPVWLPDEWSWPYDLRPLQHWWLPALLSLFMLAAVAWWLKNRPSRPIWNWVALLVLVAISLSLQVSLVYAGRPAVAAELVDRTLAEQTTGYYRVAADSDDLGVLLANYPAAMPQFESEHLRTHPPGLVIANWLIIRALERFPTLSAAAAGRIHPLRCTDLWLLEKPDSVVAGLGLAAVLPLFLAALTIPMAYLLANEIMNEGSARLAAALVATLPALLLFTPLADQVLAFLGVAGIFMLMLAMRTRHTSLFFAAGLILAVASFISLGSLAFLAIATILFVPIVWSTGSFKTGQIGWIRWAGAFLFGFLLPWLLYWLFAGVAPWQIAQTALDQHYLLVTSRRAYGLWLGFNVVDLILFSGLAVIFGFAGALIMAIKQTPKRRLQPMGGLTLALALIILLLLISGSTRGEVGRIWLFFMPLLAISAAAFLAVWAPGRRAVVLLVGLQLLLALSLGLAWRPVEAVIVVAQRPEMEAPPAGLVPLLKEFEDNITLAGFSLTSDSLEPGDVLGLTLLWQSGGASSRPYTVFAHIVDASGDLAAQQDNWPVLGQWPSTCWLPGEEITDPLAIQLPEDMPPGAYQLLIGLYDATNGRRLPTVNGQDMIKLSTIHIPS